MKTFKRVSALLLVFVMVFAISGTTVYASDAPGIRVTGAGSISATPDFAEVILGVETTAPTPQQAVSRNNAIVLDVLAALRGIGISDDDIVTHQFSLSQAMDFMTWQRVEGHDVFNSVSVTVHNLDILGDVIGAAIDAGATLSGNVRFGVNDPNALYYQALAIAIRDAENKADSISNALGVRITGIVNVTETNTWMIPRLGADSAASMMADHERQWVQTASGMSVPLQTGEIIITAHVDVVFSFAR